MHFGSLAWFLILAPSPAGLHYIGQNTSLKPNKLFRASVRLLVCHQHRHTFHVCCPLHLCQHLVHSLKARGGLLVPLATPSSGGSLARVLFQSTRNSTPATPPPPHHHPPTHTHPSKDHTARVAGTAHCSHHFPPFKPSISPTSASLLVPPFRTITSFSNLTFT